MYPLQLLGAEKSGQIPRFPLHDIQIADPAPERTDDATDRRAPRFFHRALERYMLYGRTALAVVSSAPATSVAWGRFWLPRRQPGGVSLGGPMDMGEGRTMMRRLAACTMALVLVLLTVWRPEIALAQTPSPKDTSFVAGEGAGSYTQAAAPELLGALNNVSNELDAFPSDGTPKQVKDASF